MREQIVHKINNEENFLLTYEETEYIVKNWIELHSQHRVGSIENIHGDIFIELDKQSIFKSHI